MKLIKYLIVDVKNGKWKWNDEIEHHSIAVPKMLNNLELRKEILLNIVIDNISKGMKNSVNNRSKQKFGLKIKDIKEEINLHIYMLNEFQRKVMGNLETETQVSPIMKLKKMDSPLSKKKNISLSHMYERYDNDEIISKLSKANDDLDDLLEDLDNIVEIWNRMLEIYKEPDSNKILNEMKNIKSLLNKVKNEEIYISFFILDDATRGLLSKGVTIKVDLNDAYNKFYDLIIRTLIKGVDNYRNSEESKQVEKAFSRMKELKISEGDLKILLEVKLILDIKQIDNPSYQTCYKKIGEMHGNIHQKLLELSGLKFLKLYFSKETNLIAEKTINELQNIHKKFIKYELVFVEDKKLIERNLTELEIYYKVVKELLIESPSFFLSNKLHTINNYVASKYYILDEEDLYKCLNIIADKSFIKLVILCEDLMFALRNELKNRQDVVDNDDLINVGIATGKTTMINTYVKAVEVILASLGTFMANTLHSLIKEILQNLPDEEIRRKIIKTYERTETALREFDQEGFSNEDISDENLSSLDISLEESE